MYYSMNLLIKCSFGRALSIVFLCIIAATTHALEDKKYSNWNDAIKRIASACNSVAELRIPKEDMPDKKTAEELEWSDPSRYYYGDNTAIDYKKARYCAIASYDNARPSLSEPNKILTMVYANGKGVAQNIDLAIHFACDWRVITAERVRAIEHLLQMKAGKKYKKEFDMSDDENRRSEIEHKIYNLTSEIEKYIGSLNNDETAITRGEKPSLIQEVRNRVNDYIANRVRYEIDDYNEAHDYVYAEELRMRSEWFKLLKQIMNCEINESDDSAYKAADATLNKLFQSLKSNKNLLVPTNTRRVTFNDVLETERFWIKYKQSMEELGRARCKRINSSSWDVLLTQQRIAQLEQLSRLN